MLQRKWTIGVIVKNLAVWFGRIREFMLDPANWALTDRQKEILGNAPMTTGQAATTSAAPGVSRSSATR
jgi:hypothetical protein